MAIRRRKKPNLVLPLSSMGDIAFLLIIFFMLASNFMKTGNLELEKPAAQDLEQQEAAKASIMMDVDANVWYEGQQVAVSEIESLLKPFTEKDREYLVHVSIHKDLLRKDYQPLIEAVSAAGVKLILTGEKED
jgi:biopolymer transport protein ExbD